jgi:hypothetical protein
LSGPKDFIRHSYRKSGTPFKLSLRAPFRALQIDAFGWWVKPPSSGGCFENATGAINECLLAPEGSPP